MRGTSTHGQYSYGRKYQCQCDPCRDAVHTYDKRLRFEKAHGVWRRVDPEPARRHVRALMMRGVNFDQIARASNQAVKNTQVMRLMEGGRGGKRVSFLLQPTEKAILAVTYEQASSQNAHTSALYGFRRRLQGLGYMGYGTKDMAQELGITNEAMSRIMSREVVMLHTVWRVEEMYRKFSMTPGPSVRAKWTAYRRDYAPPMAWDEDTIDDPLAGPDRDVIACIVNRCGRTASKHSLCPNHIRVCLKLDGFRSADRFHTVVVRMGFRRSMNFGQIAIQLAELKEIGMTKAEAAARAHCTVDYVEQIWAEIA